MVLHWVCCNIYQATTAQTRNADESNHEQTEQPPPKTQYGNGAKAENKRCGCGRRPQTPRTEYSHYGGVAVPECGG